MEQSVFGLQAKIMREYYKDFSKYAKGRAPERKVAWVTAFTPIEILEALDISYYYPESYAAVIAASEKEQDMLDRSALLDMSRDCCSYSCCFNGCLDAGGGPRGVPPKPDVLIATNNQCNTLPGWWNLLADKYDVPLIVLDYPGEAVDPVNAFNYVNAQHLRLISELEKLSGNILDESKLAANIDASVRSVNAWNRVISFLPSKEVKATTLFDDINFLITARCKPDTSELYTLMADEIRDAPDAADDGIPLFWLGYPLWYHKDRYLSELLDGFRITGSNYITWWSLDYSGNSPYEQLFSAYNYTFLNLSQAGRDRRLSGLIRESGARCAVVLHNKSCKCDFVSARNVGIPQAEIEIDMIDRNYLNIDRAKAQLALLKETVCSE
jgi:benzoyl-CoA reductase/2-hydroxyglutaryl-CoA dehydratase subunit BcrC/BadD/HgdB